MMQRWKLTLVLTIGVAVVAISLAHAQSGRAPARRGQAAAQAGDANATATGTKPAASTDRTANGATNEPIVIKPPLGLPALPVPADNPMTHAKIELGKKLYFDKRLSKDGTISCATCHDPKMAWAEHRPSSEGVNSQLGDRNSPTVINAAYMPVQFWDGRAQSLEEQALGPIENPIEMGHSLDSMVSTLSRIDDYAADFQKVFGTGVTADGVAKAIAAFERTVLSGNSPYDRFVNGDKTALTEQQQRGLELFDEVGCATCHAPPIFSNGRYYNAGVGADKEKADLGRMAVTERERDKGKFRVPHLRNVADTGPYFHDGSVQTLERAVAVMARGGIDNPNLSSQLRAIREAELTADEEADLVAFLKALSGEYPVVEPPVLP